MLTNSSLIYRVRPGQANTDLVLRYKLSKRVLLITLELPFRTWVTRVTIIWRSETTMMMMRFRGYLRMMRKSMRKNGDGGMKG